jgi:uncharacterized cofD-like protein
VSLGAGPGTTGPRVVAVGGGHGLAATLRAARRYAGSITAIVSVADDGGSSGRLRQELGILPPGDLRKCLVALADDSSEPARRLARAFEYRFDADEVAGHALGNLVIAGLVASTGSLQEALDEVARLLGCVGRVLPATNDVVELVAESDSGEVRGQSAVQRTSGIRKVFLEPHDVPAPPEALEAIEDADQLIVGPGSLYTSVLAALAVPEITSAVGKCSGRRVYVANLRPQPAETIGYDLADHIGALHDHGVPVDIVVADPAGIALGETDDCGVRVVLAELARPNGLAHDPGRLAKVLADLVA